MQFDNENLSNAAAAAPASDSETTSTEATSSDATPPEVKSEQTKAAEQIPATPTPVQVEPATAHEQAEAQSATTAAETVATAADEEAAGSEEMSKIMAQYDEQQEAAASNEVIEVKVVAYTEHGVQNRTPPSKCSALGNTKMATPSCRIKKCCVARRGNGLKLLLKRKKPLRAKLSTASRAAWWWISAFARFCRVRSTTCARRRTSMI